MEAIELIISHFKQEPVFAVRVYDLLVDNRHVTCIDPTGQTPDQAERGFRDRFGSGRVARVELQR